MDYKSVFTFKKRRLVAEFKLKMSKSAGFFTFSILALPPEVTFQMSIHLYDLLIEKCMLKFSKNGLVKKLSGKMYQGGSDFCFIPSKTK